MENGMEKNIEASQDAEQRKDPRIQISNKRKFVSQSQLNDLRIQVIGMQTKLEKLVLLLHDSIAPAGKKRKGTSELEGSGNQFLTNPQKYAGNQFATLQNGNQFASNLPWDLLPQFTGCRKIG